MKNTSILNKGMLISALAVITAIPLLAACGTADPQAIDQQAVSPAAQTATSTTDYETYSGAAGMITAPAGATSVTIKALGGAGGQGMSNGNVGAGALVIGSMAVTPNESFSYSVGGKGGSASYSGTGQGGWGGLSGSGGNGVSDSSDHLRDSGAGGGASTVELADGTTLVIAGGGGGAGNELPASGGNAGSSLTGSDGGEGGGYPTGPYGGKGHAGAEAGPQGGTGNTGTDIGGEGGGGGGGYRGGNGGGGAGGISGGGGGGAGSSYLSSGLTGTSVEAYTSSSPQLMLAGPSGPSDPSLSVDSSQTPGAYSNGEIEFVWNFPAS